MRTAAEEMNRRLLRARDAMDRSFVEPLACYGNKVGLELSADVEFTEEPTQQPHGIDCGARDP